MCTFIQACEIPWHVIYDVVHYMLNMRSYGMIYAFSQLLWNIRALCDGYEILCTMWYEIFVHYVMKYMCTMWLNMRYMVAMKINGKTTPRALPGSGQGLGGRYVTPLAPPYSGSRLSDHKVLQWFKRHLRPCLVVDQDLLVIMWHLGSCLIADQDLVITD